MSGYKFTAKILHTKFLKEDSLGALHFPVYENVAFEFKAAKEQDSAFQGKKPAHMYSRISNPTVEHFEQRLKSITNAVGVMAVSSGMAAIANTILAIAKACDLENKEQCFKFMNNLKLVRRATNLQDNRTLIIHPASTIFCEYSAEQKKEMGAGNNAAFSCGG